MIYNNDQIPYSETTGSIEDVYIKDDPDHLRLSDLVSDFGGEDFGMVAKIDFFSTLEVLIQWNDGRNENVSYAMARRMKTLFKELNKDMYADEK